MINLFHSVISIGIEKPFNIIHVSDTHLTFADDRDTKRKTELAERRKNFFPEAELTADYIRYLYKKTGYPVVYTGDLIDFVSEANLDAAKSFTSDVDCFTAAGNHEFSLYVGEAKEDAAYRNQSLEAVQNSFANDIRLSSRIINGVNFVAIDNSYYLIEEYQLESLKREVAKGFPVIVCVHTPLCSEELYDFMRFYKENEPAYLMSVPEEKMKYYSPSRYEQQKEDEVTHEAYEFIKNEKSIKAVLAGHIHRIAQFPLGDKMQYCVGCTDVNIIEIR